MKKCFIEICMDNAAFSDGPTCDVRRVEPTISLRREFKKVVKFYADGVERLAGAFHRKAQGVEVVNGDLPGGKGQKGDGA